MRIAICDDEEIWLASIGGCVTEYIDKENLDISVKGFKNPVELLEYEKENGGSDLYLLDIVMDGMSGLELGRQIRKYNKSSVIIYLTTARDFSLDAFSVHAFSYLVKPVDKKRLFDELDQCFAYRIPPKKEKSVITVKTSEDTMLIASDKINAVEYLDHRLVFHMSDKKEVSGVTSRASFDKQTEYIMGLAEFIKISSCYIVNMKNIVSVTKRGFKMKNGEEFPVTRKYTDAKDMFLKYKFGGTK